jgi:hypothetical protein
VGLAFIDFGFAFFLAMAFGAIANHTQVASTKCQQYVWLQINASRHVVSSMQCMSVVCNAYMEQCNIGQCIMSVQAQINQCNNVQ